MPNKHSKKSLREARAQQEQLEHENATLRIALERKNGERNPLPRSATVQWDWHCGVCANLVYAGRWKCRCGGARKDGYAFVGSIRGISQNTTQAHDARVLQRTVPGFAGPARRVIHDRNANASNATNKAFSRAPPGGDAGRQSQARSYLEVTSQGVPNTAVVLGNAAPVAPGVRRNDKPAAGAPASGSSNQLQQPGPTTVAKPITVGKPIGALDLIEQDENAQMLNDGEVDGNEDPDPTLAEDMDYAAVVREQRRYDRILGRRQDRHKRELGAVAAKEQVIVQHQGELRALQEAADATQGEIQSLGCTIETLAARAATLAAERARASDGQPQCVQHQSEASGVLYAQKCVSDVLAGIHNLPNELPEVQQLLRQLLAAIEAARNPPAPTGLQDASQVTLPMLFAGQKQAPAPAVETSTPPAEPLQKTAAPAVFNISDSQSTGEHASDASESSKTVGMQVVGECPGDKRKAEHISTSQVEEDECTGDEKPHASAELVERKTLASDRELARPGAIEAYVPPCTFENRKELLSILRGKACGSDIRGKQHRAGPY